MRNGTVKRGVTVRSGTLPVQRSSIGVPIMMDYVDQEQAVRGERRRAEQPPQAEGLVT